MAQGNLPVTSREYNILNPAKFKIEMRAPKNSGKFLKGLQKESDVIV
jgi:hypothetical protein